MNALILAAGYATRLYPLTLKKAKPLLEVGGKPIIEWLFDNLASVPALQTVYIVTNDKFANDFQNWANAYQDRPAFAKLRRDRHRGMQITVINDGSKSDDDKLGAIGDINLVLTRENLTNDDLLVIAGDNLFEQPLSDFVNAAKYSQATVAVHDVGNLEAMKKYGTVTIDGRGVITNFEEKPQKPKSTLAAVALYYYSREVLPLFTTYLAAGNNPDQPGLFLQWLYTRKPVNTFEIKGRWLDIGSKETLENADKIFAKL
ncbi:MAG TPA: nucleotidyltransferase family protein [Chthoniobacterales bacterium]|jgi:glucose-1-phosphate thymidylyltransferase|nr:nucleotidyltransferase family protein [Chthoniobacterales bacterium]